MRIRLTLDINRHRDDDGVEVMPEIFDASGSSAERAGRQRLGFQIPARTEPDPDEEDDRR